MKKLLSCVSFWTFLLITVSSFAEIKPGAFSLSPFIGGYTFDGVQHLETAPVFGIRGGYDFTKNWGAEAVFDYAATESTMNNGRSANFLRYGADALYHFMPEQKLVPFIAAGFGGRTIDYTGENNDRTHALFDYGAGLKYFITENLALRGDVRHLIVFDHAQSNVEYGLGLSFLFGGAKPATAPPKQEKVCITLEIEFDTDKADIKPKYHDEIGKVADFMKKYPDTSGVIEGHTDNVGDYDYNMKLSERRAASVRDYLVEKYGIAPERLSSKGYGYTKPIADNKTSEGRQKNRRIEAIFDCVIIKK